MKRKPGRKIKGVHIQLNRNTADVIDIVATYAIENRTSLSAAACALIRRGATVKR